MGCDIHAHVEQRWNDTSTWFHTADFYPDRNYELFGILAGVRGETEPVYPPRGLPTDLSFMVHERFEGSCFANHTPSWLTPNELENVLGHYQSRLNARIPPDFGGILAYMRALETQGQVRLVFWFDN